MASNNKEIEHQCRYLGPHEPAAERALAGNSPSSAFAKAVALKVLSGSLGRYIPTPHFRKRMAERDFDVFDCEYVIRNGKCIGAGEFCKEYRNHKYKFRGDLDGVEFDAVFALSTDHDYTAAPLLILITGCFKTTSGCRGRAY